MKVHFLEQFFIFIRFQNNISFNEYYAFYVIVVQWLQAPWHVFLKKRCFYGVPSPNDYHHQCRTEILHTRKVRMSRDVSSGPDSSRICESKTVPWSPVGS